MTEPVLDGDQKTHAVASSRLPRRPMTNGEYVVDMSENRFLSGTPALLGGSRKNAGQ
jgi:hypothetical protein